MEGDEQDQQQLSQQQIEYWMKAALEQAQLAVKCDEIPVGYGKYEKISGSHNLTNLYKNASRHCQINCINQMEKLLTKQQIAKCILFVTVQPCIMCTFALNLMNIKFVYFGQFNDKFGGCGSLRKDNKFAIKGGILQKQSLQIIKEFYQRGNQKIPQQLRNRSRKKIKTNE